MEKVEIRAVIKYICKKEISHKEIHENFMYTLGKESPSCSTVKNGLLNLRGAGRALEMMSGLGGQKRPPMTVRDLVMCNRRRDTQNGPGLTFQDIFCLATMMNLI
jgi:hypothetical protein